MRDYDSMEYRKYTTKSEFDKAIHTLEGILKGIAIDRSINVQEIEELQNWCSLHRHHIKKAPFNELIPLIEMSLKDNVLTKEEIEDILWVCDNFKTGSAYYDVITSDIQRLQGILHGILSDNIINDEEIKALSIWLDENEHLMNTYPYDEVYSLVLSVLSDGKIDEKERDMLKVFFSEFIDLKESYNINANEISEIKANIKITGICAACPEIKVENHCFCFTGVSNRAKRSDIKNIVESLGGKFSESMNMKVNYLVVGNEGNPCWAFSCYGRKVEQAIELRKAGKKVLIVHENDFWDAVEDLKIG